MAYRRKASYRRSPIKRRRRSYRRAARRAPARAYTKRRRRSMAKPKISKFVLAQLDPFSDKVQGAKIPDSNTQPSAVTTVEDEWPLSTGATYGTNVTVLRPFVESMSVPAATVASATSWTWAASFGGGVDSSKLTSVATNNILVRTVAYGARISCAMSPNNVTGYVHICLAPINNYLSATWSFPTSVSDMQNSPFYKRYPLATLTQRPLKVVSKILDENAYRYISPTSPGDGNAGGANHLAHSGWAPIMIAVTGAPLNSNPVSVESILHLECIPNVASSNGVSPAASNDARQMEYATNVATHNPAGFLEGMLDSAGNYYNNAQQRLATAADELLARSYAGAQNYAYSFGQNAAGALAAYFLGRGANQLVPYRGG